MGDLSGENRVLKERIDALERRAQDLQVLIDDNDNYKKSYEECLKNFDLA